MDMSFVTMSMVPSVSPPVWGAAVGGVGVCGGGGGSGGGGGPLFPRRVVVSKKIIKVNNRIRNK